MTQTLKTTSTKDEIIKMIERLPDDCTLEDIQYHLYVRQIVAQGMKDIEEGKVVSQEEAQGRLNEWLKSHGLGER